MLDAHPLLAIPPETHLFPRIARACKQGVERPTDMLGVITASRYWPDFNLDPGDLRQRLEEAQPLTATSTLRAFYRTYADAAGKPRWGDKTPGSLTRIKRIARALPEARFVHIVRDGRDVAVSLSAAYFGPRTPAAAAQRWVDGIAKGRADGAKVGYYREVRYEDLVRDPEPILREVCDFIELPWDRSMLDYHRRAPARLAEIDRGLRAGAREEAVPARQRTAILARAAQPPQADRIGRWRSDLAPEDLRAVNAVAGDLLAQLGYGSEGLDGGLPASGSHRLA